MSSAINFGSRFCNGTVGVGFKKIYVNDEQPLQPSKTRAEQASDNTWSKNISFSQEKISLADLNRKKPQYDLMIRHIVDHDDRSIEELVTFGYHGQVRAIRCDTSEYRNFKNCIFSREI